MLRTGKSIKVFFIFAICLVWLLSCIRCQVGESIDGYVQSNTFINLGEFQKHYTGSLEKQRDFSQRFEVSKTDVITQKAQLFADHYPASNERRIDLFRSRIENIGGAYVGVGTDQNLTFIAWARSPVAYLMDFDSVIVYVNRLHFLFLAESPTYEDFKKMWSRANRISTAKLISDRLSKNSDFAKYQEAYAVAMQLGGGVPDRFNELDWMTKHYGFRSFHNDPADYNFIRQMVLDGRIQAVVGDMNGEVTFREISKSVQSLRVPIRLVYLSNAEEYFRYPQAFRDTIKSLYTDDKSMIIRTVTAGAKEFGYPDGEKFVETHPFHYNLQNIQKMMVWMKDAPQPLWVYHMLKKRTDVERGFSVLNQDPYESGFLPPKKELQPVDESKK